MNNHRATLADRLFSADGSQANEALAKVVFKADGTGLLSYKTKVEPFKWQLHKNIVRLTVQRGAKRVVVNWTLATTSGKVIGQHYKGYTVDSDDIGGLFVGKAFLIYKRW